MTNQLEQQIADSRDAIESLVREIEKVIVGHQSVIRQLIVALFSGGHILLEGVPGLGKTKLVKTLSQSMNLSFRRIQFTPDLMPADILGTEVFHEDEDGNRHFRFREGPIFANLVLADEINRATPKTQSALLESMQEQAVTTGGKKRELAPPFFVVATQNPIEMEGTYPLPEAQVDRFFFKITLNRPGTDETIEILERTTTSSEPDVTQQLNQEKIIQIQNLVRKITAVPEMKAYAARLIDATHPDSERAPESVQRYVRYGSSPRGAQALILSAKVNALLDGRPHVSFEDIRKHAIPALRHRILLNFEGEAENILTDTLIDDCIDRVPEMNEQTDQLLEELQETSS